jgi:hypothetical protein
MTLMTVLSRLACSAFWKKVKAPQQQGPPMKKIEIQPDMSVDALLQMMDGDDIVLTRGGNAVALLSEFEDEAYWQAIENDPEFIASIAQAREEIRQGKGIPMEQVKKELGLD